MNIEKKLIQNNFTKGRTFYGKKYPVKRVVLHTYDGKGTSLFNWFNKITTKASAHYAVLKDGTVEQYVEDSNMSWHAGTTAANGLPNNNWESIGIEHQDDDNPADSVRTPELYEASAQLVAELCKRHNIPCRLLSKAERWGSGISLHNQYVSKSCPGGLDANRIVARANEILNGASTPEPIPVPSGEFFQLKGKAPIWTSAAIGELIKAGVWSGNWMDHNTEFIRLNGSTPKDGWQNITKWGTKGLVRYAELKAPEPIPTPDVIVYQVIRDGEEILGEYPDRDTASKMYEAFKDDELLPNGTWFILLRKNITKNINDELAREVIVNGNTPEPTPEPEKPEVPQEEEKTKTIYFLELNGEEKEKIEVEENPRDYERMKEFFHEYVSKATPTDIIIAYSELHYKETVVKKILLFYSREYELTIAGKNNLIGDLRAQLIEAEKTFIKKYLERFKNLFINLFDMNNSNLSLKDRASFGLKKVVSMWKWLVTAGVITFFFTQFDSLKGAVTGDGQIDWGKVQVMVFFAVVNTLVFFGGKVGEGEDK